MSSYTQVQAENFAKHETTAEDWEVCEFDGFLNGRPNYKRRFPQVQGWSMGNAIAEYIGGDLHCELCGHPIVYDHYIECESKEITMLVGSDCVNSFKGAHFSEKLEKVYREDQTRLMFHDWIMPAWEEFKEIYSGGSRWNDGIRYHDKKQWAYMKEIRKIVKFQNGNVYAPYGLVATDPSELSTRKLLGIMKRGAQNGLTLPDLYFKIIEKRPLPRKKEESND